jgi:subfamily B ATP-binding cassette protein MsbA
MKENQGPLRIHPAVSKEHKEAAAVLMRILRYALPYWKLVIGAGLCTLLTNVLALMQPQLIKYIMDHVLAGEPVYGTRMFMLNACVGAFVVLVILKGAFGYGQGYLLPAGVQQAVRDIRDAVFNQIQFLPLRFFERYKTGDLLMRIVNDTNNLATVLGMELITFANNIIVILGAMGWMLWKDWLMTIVIIAISPLVAWSVAHFSGLVKSAVTKNQEQSADIFSSISETVQGIKVVKGFTQEDYEIKRFKAQNQALYSIMMKVIQLTVTQTPVVEFLAAIGIGVAVWYGGWQVIQGKFTVGDIFGFWGYMIMATNPLNRISQTFTQLQTTLVSANRILEVLDSPSEVRDTADAKDLPRVDGKIEFLGVSFEYDPGVPVLKDVSFTVPAGTILALVGPSGAGKSTTAALLPRFYDPQGGEIRIDGHDIRKVKLKSLRQQIGIVPQDTVLFSGTIRDNIAYGNRNASMDHVIEAARVANAHDFIMEMQDGYETIVGERGLNLSGGQRQRIAIARAVLRDPRILILDEATSSVDAQSESLIQEALDRLMKTRTTIIIAHRLSTVKKADRILVIDDGVIAEAGTHQELLDSGGLYTTFCRTQFLESCEMLEKAS